MSDELCPDHWFPVSGWPMATLPKKGCLVEVRVSAKPDNSERRRTAFAVGADLPAGARAGRASASGCGLGGRADRLDAADDAVTIAGSVSLGS